MHKDLIENKLYQSMYQLMKANLIKEISIMYYSAIYIHFIMGIYCQSYIGSIILANLVQRKALKK